MTHLVCTTSSIFSNERSVFRHTLVHVQGLSEPGVFLSPAVMPQPTAHQTQPLLSPPNTPNQDIIPRCAAWLPRATLDFHVCATAQSAAMKGQRLPAQLLHLPPLNTKERLPLCLNTGGTKGTPVMAPLPRTHLGCGTSAEG